MTKHETQRSLLIKLFFFLFVSQVFFIHWVGWGESSRFNLTRAIAEEGTISINSYKDNTSDRVLFEGNYYSDKPPLVSILSVPLHKLIISSFPEETIEKNVVLKREVGLTFLEESLFLPFSIKLSMVISTILTSLLPHIFVSLLIFQLSLKILKSVKKSVAVTFLYSFGTLVFPYSLIYFGNSLLTLLVFSSFFLLFTRGIHTKNLLFSGFLLGIASLVDYLALFFFPAFILYVAFKTKSFQKVFIFLSSVLFGLSFLLFYQYTIFHNPFEVTYKHTDPKIWTNALLNAQYGIESIIPNISKFYRITIDSYRGIFFYYPVIFVLLFGVFKARKMWKEEAIFIFSLFLTFLYFFSISWNWWGGTGFSIRFFSPVMPFLMFGAITLLKIKMNKRLLGIVFVTIALSLFVNLLSLQGFENTIEDPINIYPRNAEKVNSFAFIGAPLFTKYFDEFSFKGPTPKLFNSLFYDSNSFLDIRDNIERPEGSLLENKLYLFNNFYIKTGFFLLTLNVLLFIFLFRRYLKEKW